VDQLLDTYAAFFFPIIFVGMWVLICHLLSATGGWRGLATEYTESLPFSGEKWRMQSVRIGWVGYNGCVTIGANLTAIFLSVWFPFRLGHPPLVIPYSDIAGTEVSGAVFKYVDLTFTKGFPTNIRLSKKQADRIEAQSNGAWTYERT